MNGYAGMGGHMPIGAKDYQAFLELIDSKAIQGASLSVLMPGIIDVWIAVDNEFLKIQHEKEEKRRKAEDRKNAANKLRNRSSRR